MADARDDDDMRSPVAVHRPPVVKTAAWSIPVIATAADERTTSPSAFLAVSAQHP